jgi:hypothetical protein
MNRTFVLALSSALLAVPALHAQDAEPQKVDFAARVLPILEARCFSCHQAPKADARGRLQKPKGGLRLDGAHWIQKGGDTGRVVVAGQPTKSELLRRVELPEDDADLMPPKGGPLAASEIETLRAWVRGGAELGEWIGAAGPADAPGAAHAPVRKTSTASAREAALRELAAGLEPLPANVLAKQDREKLRLEPALPGSALLRASFPAHRSEIGDAEVLALAPLVEHLAVLDLARSKIGSKSLAFVARLPRLWKLDLSDTGLAARDLETLAPALRAVRELNLNGTLVDDTSLTWIAGLPSLEDLYLWRSKVSEQGVSKLRAAKPDLRIRLTLELPEPPKQDGEAERGRRRR